MSKEELAKPAAKDFNLLKVELINLIHKYPHLHTTVNEMLWSPKKNSHTPNDVFELMYGYECV